MTTPAPAGGAPDPVPPAYLAQHIHDALAVGPTA